MNGKDIRMLISSLIGFLFLILVFVSMEDPLNLYKFPKLQIKQKLELEFCKNN